jgi:hypothetical protein
VQSFTARSVSQADASVYSPAVLRLRDQSRAGWERIAQPTDPGPRVSEPLVRSSARRLARMP